ncbi:ABC transporter ATP-binding protein [Microaerobacter geothermalis]|uniref:ABC transporter ATP-binding protein n=1 Tax=Microaerobacter geothermalis TaxID=674972 RepID=UPI001F35D212|nr:ABC transporter ATP-binding protein [Microaerobacter geothermalis]MCF6094136.1 ABC transporter ATP-binding protein [Microaerobacter geothermalis]
MQEPLLSIKDLKIYFYCDDNKVIPAVDGVNLSIQKREVLALVGESGCGKTVTSLSIMGLVPPPGRVENGFIIFQGKELSQLSDEEMNVIRGNEISMIFQEPMTSLNPVLRIGEQISESLRYHLNMNRKDARQRTIQLLKEVGLPRAEEMVDEYPHQLSGGMRQRVMIAMALACNPKLIIADEPTTALDVTIQAQIIEVLKKIKEKMNTSILLISHDLGVVAELADRVAVMYAGKVVEEANVEDIYSYTSHPYTIGLMKSVPNLEDDTERLNFIKGTVPTGDQFLNGCSFAPRCEWQEKFCWVSVPPLETIRPNHRVRCFLAKKVFS